jgi:hypothetical protein
MLLAFAVLAMASLPALGASGTALNEALVRLKQVQRELPGARAVAYQRLAPFELHAQCNYCSREFLGICTEHSTTSWRQAVDFSLPRDAGMPADGYGLAQQWIAGLPAFSARFDGYADVVLGVEQAIRQGIGPNEEQRRDATEALLELTGELGRSSVQLDAGVRALAVAIERQDAYRRAIRQAIDGADRAAQNAWRELDAAARKRRCSESVHAQFDAIGGELSSATQAVAGAIEQLVASDREGERALAALLGAVISARGEVESVLRLLAAGSTDQLGSFLGRLDLAAGKRQWSELAIASAP